MAEASDMKEPGYWRNGVVIAPWSASYPYTFQVSAGESVNIIEREGEWAGWLWCVNHAGTGAWVPESYLDIRSDHAVLLHDYESTELDANVGDILHLGKHVSGWVWCKDSEGREGWLPKNCIWEP
jgi:hypothetical protein